MPSSRHDREAKALALWKCKDPISWKSALEMAKERASTPSSAGPRLAADPGLDAFFYDDLPSALSRPSSPPSRHPIAELDAGQLARVVEWKLARGTWRPRLLDYAKSARGEDVAAAAAAAAEAFSDGRAPLPPPPLEAIGRAIDALSSLKGVGPATATALLSAADASVPFLSDEAGAVVLGSREYTRPAALEVASALRERAEELNNELKNIGDKRGDEGDESFRWTARSVERALWSASRAAAADEREQDKEGKRQGRSKQGEAKTGSATAPEKKKRKR